jgi:hypothetical protein
MPQLHIRYNGETYDLDFNDLDIGDLSSDQEVQAAAARYFDKPVGNFSTLKVDRNTENEDITLRPPAVFG